MNTENDSGQQVRLSAELGVSRRLRACAECEQAPLGPLLTDAADEIERLRKDADAAESVLSELAAAQAMRAEKAEEDADDLREVLGCVMAFATAKCVGDEKWIDKARALLTPNT